jgi:uncharacterized phage-like protein YoqJ
MKSLGVTGQRPKSLGLASFEPSDLVWRNAGELVRVIILHGGYEKLISGAALGFDMIAAKAAVESKIYLELAIPFDGFQKRWPTQDLKRLDWLINRANKVTYVCDPGYETWKYQKRNEYVVDNSDYMVALHDGSPGGTKRCLDYAVSQGKPYSVYSPRFK